MAASRAPVIRASTVSGSGGGIGAGISDFLSGLARRKAEEERKEDERVKEEAQIALSQAKARIETGWSDDEANGLFHGKSAAEVVQLRKKRADEELEALKTVGGGRIEYESVLADGEFWAAGKIDSDTQARKERERVAALSRHVAATAKRKGQLKTDTERLEVMLASDDPKLVNQGFEQLGEIKRERLFLAGQTAPGEGVEKDAYTKIDDEFRVLPMRAVLRRAAQSGNLDAYPALKRRMINRTDYMPDGKTRFSGPATEEEKTAAFGEFDSVWETNVRQREKQETLDEDAAKTRTEDEVKGVGKLLFKLDAKGDPVIPLDVGLRIIGAQEGFQSGDSAFTKLHTRYNTWHSNLGNADDAAEQDRIQSSAVAAQHMQDARGGMAGATTKAQLEGVELAAEMANGRGELSDAQLQDVQGQVEARGKIIDALDREDDDEVQENRKRLRPLFKGWQTEAGAPMQNGVTFTTKEYSARKSAFYTNAEMILTPALTKSGLLDARMLQAVDGFVKAQAATIQDGDSDAYHWLSTPDFATAPSETLGGGKSVERLADLVARAGGLKGLTDAAGFGWIGMHFPNEMRFAEGNAFDKGGTADALQARFMAEGLGPGEAATRAAWVMGYYLEPGLRVIEAIRSGRRIDMDGEPGEP